MRVKVEGGVAYQLTTAHPPLTNEVADALIAEWSRFGVQFRKGQRAGAICVYVRSTASAFEEWHRRLAESRLDVGEKLGVSLYTHSNTYLPNQTYFSPGENWHEIVAFIDSNYLSNSVSNSTGATSYERLLRRAKKKWWQFWK